MKAALAACALLVACGEPEWAAPPPRDGLVEAHLRGVTPREAGRRLWMTHCAICHGLEGRGDGFNADLLTSRPAPAAEIVARTGAALHAAIARGSRAGGRSPQCPPWEGVLGRQGVAEVSLWMQQLATSAPSP